LKPSESLLRVSYLVSYVIFERTTDCVQPGAT